MPSVWKIIFEMVKFKRLLSTEKEPPKCFHTRIEWLHSVDVLVRLREWSGTSLPVTSSELGRSRAHDVPYFRKS